MKLKHLTVTAAIALVIVAGHFLSKPQAAHAEPPKPATKAGWWIKVRTDKTEATSITFQIGTREKDREDWRTWKSSDPTEFDVPDKYLQVQRLYIRGTANPTGRNAWFCMMYKDHGVKHLDFDDSEDQEKQQSDRDDECK
jgi:hypothetical protein